MEFFKSNSNIDFMAQQRNAAIFSIVLFLFSLLALAINGLNWGLDFTGGMQVQMSYAQSADLNDIRHRLARIGFEEASVISYGSSHDVLVTLVPKKILGKQQENEFQQNETVHRIMKALPGAKKEEVNFIGPQVGNEMVQKSILAVIIALLGTMIYIAIRFDLRFSVGSTIALIHDPILILGIFALFHLEFNLITLAAILTVIGYSLNDTIVIFDRVRENFRKMRKASTLEVMNQSINQTLSRTIMTSVLTLTVVVALLVLGGNVLFGFALALAIGIIIGTYSSIYVAGSLSLMLGVDRSHVLSTTSSEEKEKNKRLP